MQFIDLKAQQQRIRSGIERRIKRVLEHGRYIMGPEVAELEEKLAAVAGTKHAVSCSSGTDALLMALLAHGVRRGDILFAPSFTFIATAEVLPLLGAVPAFVDIDPETFNIDPGSLREAILQAKKDDNGTLRGIIPVDLFGLLADYDAINAIAEEFGLFVLQDAAQSFGASFEGRRAGSNAQIAATSFFPAKPLGCYGDAGAVLCNDDVVSQKLRSIRVHGRGSHEYESVRIGLNGRCDTIQAAILLEKLEIFEDEIKRRHRVAARYTEKLGEKYSVQRIPARHVSVWAQYSLLSGDRDGDLDRLKEHGIPTAIYYPTPLHLQEAFQNVCYSPVPLTHSERVCRQIFSLPMHPYLSEEDQDRIVEILLTG